MKKIVASIILISLFGASYLAAQQPKREFRGAWVHTVGNKDYRNMTTNEMKKHFTDLLDSFQASGINAVIFQVRPQADALYISSIEPWSRFITGTQGQAPNPLWDPLAFMVEECHNRGMELHAWFNPYRVTSNDTEELVSSHLYYSKPELFVKYGKQLYFDPGEPESRQHTVKVIVDVVSRYDIDAVHFDDYFYPYRVEGEEFPDSKSFAKYHTADGFSSEQLNDWRRNNVNVLVKELGDTIKKVKPWVKFGISPFGVWRNSSVDPKGSLSNAGQTNYDDLFADILLWVQEGWIDYNVPQLYWEIGHPRADFTPLIKWWSDNRYNAHLYIGQNIDKTVQVPVTDNDGKTDTVSQLHQKMMLVRTNSNIDGNVWWPGYRIPKNPGGFTDSLKNDYQHFPALIPLYTHIDTTSPAPVTGIVASKSKKHGDKISWKAVSTTNEMDKAAYFCVYRFKKNEQVNLDNPEYLVKITREPFYLIPADDKNNDYKYVITALDRLQNESEPSKEVTL